MAYQPPGTRMNVAYIRGTAPLEQAMRERDVNGHELSLLSGTSAQTISQLRLGQRNSVRVSIARGIERALRVEEGTLFVPATELANAAELDELLGKARSKGRAKASAA